MSDAIYCYPPDYKVLRNKFELTDATQLDFEERKCVSDRLVEGCPNGDFDLVHLQSIHKHLFQDVYDWAGQTRELNISKGPTTFQAHQFIETGINDIHQRIVSANYLRGTSPQAFAQKAGELIGDLNHAHPFREGNGRTQMQYLKQLAEKAGHPIDLCKIDADQWIAASIRSNDADYAPMQKCIHAAIESGGIQEEQSQNAGSEGEGPQISQKRYAESVKKVRDRSNALRHDQGQELE